MKNLNKLQIEAAKFSMYTLDTIPEQWTKKQILNGSTFDYSDRIHNNFSLPSEILNKFEHGLFWQCKKQFKNSNPTEVELYYIDHSELLFLSPQGNLLRLQKDKNKYYFMLHYCYQREVQNVSYYVRQEAKKNSGIVEPNYIGVFTEKKINDWFDFCDKEAELNKQIVSSSEGKNKEIEEQIQSFIGSVPCTVQKWANNTEVRTKHFNVVFTHDKSSQYLSHKVTFSGSLKDITKLENHGL